jgi:cell division inhibitor SulA
MQSYVTEDKIYCIYVAPSEGLIREHARLAGFPINRIAEITAIIDPATSEAAVAEHDRRHDYAKEAGVY